MSSALIAYGFGSFGDVNKIPVLGFDIGAGCPSGTERFLTNYSETDATGSITVDSECQISFDTLQRNEISYVVHDKGDQYYEGDFKHRFTANVTANSNNNWVVALWGIGNSSSSTIHDSNDFIAVQYYGNGGSPIIRVIDRSGGGSRTLLTNTSTGGNMSVGTQYWFEVERVDSTDSFVVRIYDADTYDAADLVETVTNTLTTTGKDYRYQYGLSAWNDGDASHTCTGWIKNLDLYPNTYSADYEDFTGYNDSTDPNNHHAIATQHRIDFQAIDQDEDAYIYKDFGANYFNGDFTQRVSINVKHANTGSYGKIVCWGMGNTLDDAHNIADGIFLRFDNNNDTPRFQLYERSGSATYNTQNSTATINIDTEYGIEIERVDSSNQLTAKIYDETFTTLHETLTISTLQGTGVDWRYLFPLSTINSATANQDLIGYITKLDTDATQPAVSGTMSLQVPPPTLEMYGSVIGAPVVSGYMDLQVPAPTLTMSGLVGTGVTGTMDLQIPPPTLTMSGSVYTPGGPVDTPESRVIEVGAKDRTIDIPGNDRVIEVTS